MTWSLIQTSAKAPFAARFIATVAKLGHVGLGILHLGSRIAGRAVDLDHLEARVEELRAEACAGLAQDAIARRRADERHPGAREPSARPTPLEAGRRGDQKDGGTEPDDSWLPHVVASVGRVRRVREPPQVFLGDRARADRVARLHERHELLIECLRDERALR